MPLARRQSSGTTISNPSPYLFVQGGYNGATWADVFYKYWQVKSQDEALTLRSTGCLPDLPPVQQEGELSVEQLIFPAQGSVYQNYPTKLAAAIRTAHPATNPLVRFSVQDASNTLVTFDLAEVCFSVTGDISESTIAFQFDLPRQTDVTFGGASILTSATNATLGDIPDDDPTAVTLHKLATTPQLPAGSFYLLLTLLVGGMALKRMRN